MPLGVALWEELIREACGVCVCARARSFISLFFKSQLNIFIGSKDGNFLVHPQEGWEGCESKEPSCVWEYRKSQHLFMELVMGCFSWHRTNDSTTGVSKTIDRKVCLQWNCCFTPVNKSHLPFGVNRHNDSLWEMWGHGNPLVGKKALVSAHYTLAKWLWASYSPLSFSFFISTKAKIVPTSQGCRKGLIIEPSPY